VTSRPDAVLIPHASGLVSGAMEESFLDLRRAISEAREGFAQSRPGLVVVTCSELLSVGPFRLLSASHYSGTLGGGSVPDIRYSHDGVDTELARNLVRRLRLSGVDSETGFYEPLDFGTAVALHHLFPAGGVPVLPVAVPSGALRPGFRFGSVLAELLREREIDALWIAAGALSHRISKEPDLIREEGESFDRELLDSLGAGQIDPLVDLTARTLSAVAADAGLAHIAPLLGFVGEGFRAKVLAYSGIFGAGNAVVTFRSGGRRTQELEVVGVGSKGVPS